MEGEHELAKGSRGKSILSDFKDFRGLPEVDVDGFDDYES